MRFANPLFFFLFFPLLIFLFFHFRRLSHAAIRYANVAALKQIATVKTAYISRLVLALRVLILSLIIIALARPQSVFVEREVSSEGVDIMLALDVSRSMSAEDFKPKNRLTVAKQTMQEFIQKRQSDRIGLVVFSGQAYTQCPLTLDYRILLNLLDQVHFDMAGQIGRAHV